MRERVYAAVTELGYEPDILAQSLRRGLTTTIGFLVGDISNPLFSDIALGAERVLNAAGHAMLIANSQGGADRDAVQLRLLRQRRVDGFILSLSDETDPRTIEQLKTLDRPFVLLDREIQGIDATAVVSDHTAGMRATARHLIELGHRRIGLISGDPNVRPTRARAEALMAVCAEHEGVSALIEYGSYKVAHGEAATEAMLARPDAPTAFLAGGNQILIGVLRALRRHNLRVPHDVSLVACDRTPLAEFLDPPLAIIDREPKEMGKVAAELLLATTQDATPRRVELPVIFHPHQSCGPPRLRRDQ